MKFHRIALLVFLTLFATACERGRKTRNESFLELPMVTPIQDFEMKIGVVLKGPKELSSAPGVGVVIVDIGMGDENKMNLVGAIVAMNQEIKFGDRLEVRMDYIPDHRYFQLGHVRSARKVNNKYHN